MTFYDLATSGESAELKRLWVSPEYIDLSVGRDLFRHAKSRASFLGSKMLHIESELKAEDFYLKMGARSVGETVFENFGTSRTLPLMSAGIL